MFLTGPKPPCELPVTTMRNNSDRYTLHSGSKFCSLQHSVTIRNTCNIYASHGVQGPLVVSVLSQSQCKIPATKYISQGPEGVVIVAEEEDVKKKLWSRTRKTKTNLTRKTNSRITVYRITQRASRAEQRSRMTPAPTHSTTVPLQFSWLPSAWLSPVGGR